MLGCYKMTREEIVKRLQKSKITTDGYYVCKEFRNMNKALGDKLDKKYKYSRDYFENKICFSQSDIELYLETNTKSGDIDRMRQRDNYIYNIIKDDVELYDLDDYIDGGNFTLNELIDTAIYFYNCKY